MDQMWDMKKAEWKAMYLEHNSAHSMENKLVDWKAVLTATKKVEWMAE